MDDRLAFVKRVQAIEGDVERLSQLQGDYLHPTHDGTPRYYLPVVPFRHEQCFGDIVCLKQRSPGLASVNWHCAPFP